MFDYVLLALLVGAMGLLIHEIRAKNKLKAEYEVKIKKERDEAIKRSRSALEGRVYEQLVPILPEWPYLPSDARFLGNPIDFVVFKGLCNGKVEEVIIVEIKKGKSTATKTQRQIRKAIENGNVSWHLITLE